MNMMKYCINHPDSFIWFGPAFLFGFFGFIITVLTELVTIFYVSTVKDVVRIMTKQISMFFVAKTAEFFAASLSKSNKLKSAKVPKMIVSVYRAVNDTVKLRPDQSKVGLKAAKVIYAIMRVLYCVFIFYLMPFGISFMPYLAVKFHTRHSPIE